MNTHSNTSVNICLKGFGAIEVSVTGEDLGLLLSFIIKVVGYEEMKYLIDDLNSIL